MDITTKHKSILVIDSGIGGLSTLSEIIQLLPANYIYFADNKHSPYGSKSDGFLQKRLSFIISTILKKHKLSMVILACNTATTSSIEFLRRNFPKIVFIGTEPAFKVAQDRHFKSIAILATPCTISHLTSKYKNIPNYIADSKLASIIERFFIFPSPKTKLDLLRKLYIIKHSTKMNDSLILGCTHYVLIKTKLSKILDIPIIDGNNGVAKQVFRLYSKKPHTNHSIKLILSDNNSNCLQKYKKILRQILAKQINLC